MIRLKNILILIMI